MDVGGAGAKRDDDSVLTPDVNVGERPEPSPATDSPDIGKIGEALRTVEVRSLGITLLLVLACLYTLYFARVFLLPLVIALLLTFLLQPLIRALERLRIPPALGAALVILVFLGAAGFGVSRLVGPAQNWLARAPETFEAVTAKLRVLREPMQEVSETAEEVQEAAGGGEPEATTVVVEGPSILSRVFGTTQVLVAALLEIVVLLYFLLAAGDLFLQKLIKVLPQLRDKKKAVRIARETEASVSVYLATVALVNLGEGLLLAFVLWLIGMPNPLLWGAAATVLEFIPYIGAFFLVAVLTFAGLATFDDVGRALLVPASFLAINLIQGNFLSPMILGRRLTLNPVAIFVGVAFWWWLWGLPGAFVAVPMMATFKIFCDHIETLTPIGEFLGK